MPATTGEALALVSKNVSVAPMVLLSVVDHANRTAKGSGRRVIGVLLGHDDGKTVRVSNSFAVPFEEDERDPSVHFIDHSYIENFKDAMRKVNAKERLVGWYSTGPRLRSSDLRINEIFRRWTPNPVLVIVDVSGREGFPTDAYFAVEEIKDDGTSTSKTFVHTPSTIEAEEAEEIGVEHLLRDIRDVAVGTLSTRVTAQLQSLQGLHLRLREIGAYLQKVLDGELPVNHAILGNLQDIFNLLPNISTPPASRPNSTNQVENSELARAMRVKTNDQLMTIYLSSLVRAITAFHDLIDNKIQNRQQAEEQEAKKDEEKKEGEKDDKKAATNGEVKKDSEEDPKSKGKKKS